MAQEDILFPSGDLQLEGVFHYPETGAPFAASIVCHPHTDFGGDMDNNVVMGVTENLVEAGMAALRFNFRGAGRSGGRCEQGKGEIGDTLAALDYLEKRRDVDAGRIFLVGYSFGAFVGLRAAVSDPRIKAWVAVSPPFVMGDDFIYLAESDKPKLLMTGSGDNYSPPQDLQALFQKLKEPKEIHIIKGTDHFYWGLEQVAGGIAVEFLKKL